MKEIPGGEMAVVEQEGAYEVSTQAAFGAAMQWLATSGYRQAGPPMAFFQGDMMGGAGTRPEVRVPGVKVQ